MAACLLKGNLFAGFADEDHQLCLIIQLAGDGGDRDLCAMRRQRVGKLAEQHRADWNFRLGFLDMEGIVQAYADNFLRPRYRR